MRKLVVLCLFLTGCATFSDRSCETDGFDTVYKFKPRGEFPWVGKECYYKEKQ